VSVQVSNIDWLLTDIEYVKVDKYTRAKNTLTENTRCNTPGGRASERVGVSASMASAPAEPRRGTVGTAQGKIQLLTPD